MAAIREELVLLDRFSATMSRYLNGLYQAVSASAALTDASAALADAAAQAARTAAQTVQDQERVNASLRRGASAASGLTRQLGALAGAYVSLRSAQRFVALSDAMTQNTARLDRMNDGRQTTPELRDMLYQSAQRSRGDYMGTVDLAAKLGTMAPDAFSSSQELVAFAEQLNKQFTLAGTSAQGMDAAMLQLTQAMSAGALRGEELNSVLEQAPTIAQAIAKYLGVSVGGMRELASEGKITAQVVKNALFHAAEETNASFEAIPLTYEQAWTMAGNAAVKSMEPALEQLNALLNSELGQTALDSLISGFGLLGRAAAGAVDLLAGGAQMIAENWGLVSDLLQFAAGALLALGAVSAGAAAVHLIAWAAANAPLLLLAAGAGVAILAMYSMGMTSQEVFEQIAQGAGWLYATGYNLVAASWNLIAAFAEFFANVFDNPAAAIANLFLGLFNFIMDIVSNAAGAIDALLGSDISGAVKKFQHGVNKFVHDVFGENQYKVQRMELISHADTMAQFGAAGGRIGKALDEFQAGDLLGSGGSGGFLTDYSGMLGGISGQLKTIGGDTAAIKRSVSLSEEDMQMLVDMAAQRYVNHINLTAQTPVITIHGQNTGNFQEDARWLEDTLMRLLVEQAASHTDQSYI